MALVRCDFFSEVLEVGTSTTVLLPQASEDQVGVTGTAGGMPEPIASHFDAHVHIVSAP